MGTVCRRTKKKHTARLDPEGLYGSGAVLGYRPLDVREMTLDEFGACVAGWNRAQGTGPAPDLSDADYDALAALTDVFNGVSHGEG
ncbi:hypothetical protein JCM7686_1249 [Paracoccus aminophilus JCM 7686]|uniref:Uncharacterized protein n=1 Tax=Paracoccus aminophilus JCM 7686 TaxID=1367847 RepID=S5YSY9_PARAH|nr:hypothetical protein JCM7686_1249 [Paracoccus aminophilus JCM 7686]